MHAHGGAASMRIGLVPVAAVAAAGWAREIDSIAAVAVAVVVAAAIGWTGGAIGQIFE